jgi:hypothetical protein
MCDDQVMNGRPLGLYRHSGHETILLKRQQDDYKNGHVRSTGLFSRLAKKIKISGFHDPTDPGTTVLHYLNSYRLPVVVFALDSQSS